MWLLYSDRLQLGEEDKELEVQLSRPVTAFEVYSKWNGLISSWQRKGCLEQGAFNLGPEKGIS